MLVARRRLAAMVIAWVSAAWLLSNNGQSVRAAEGPRPLTIPADAHYTFLRLPDGTVMGIGQRSPDAAGEPQTISARYSNDNGATWDEPKTLCPAPSGPGAWSLTQSLVDRDGEVHAFFMIAPADGAIVDRGEAERPLVGELLSARIDIGYLRSLDGRTRWSKPKVLWVGYTGALNSVIQMESGRILLPFSYLTKRSWDNRGEGLAAFTFMGQYNSTLIYSDNGGETWSLGTDLLTPVPDIVSAYGAVEPVVVQLADGRVWNLIRTQNGRFWESFSADGAAWSEPKPSSILSSDSPAGLVRLSDDRIVLFWNNCLRYPYAYGGRQVLHAAISADSGRTWRGFREVGRDPFRNEAPPQAQDYGTAYPMPMLANDDQVIFVSGQGKGRVMRKSLDPAWLYETQQSSDFVQRAEEWSTFGAKGAEIVPHPDDPSRNALQIRKTDPGWPAAAVWNFPAGGTGRLRLRLCVQPGSQGALVALTDHFSAPFDLEDHFHSNFNLWIGPEGRLPHGESLKSNEWQTLDLRWNAKENACQVELNGEAVGSLPVVRSSPNTCYLRIRSTAEKTETGGILVEAAEVELADSP